MYNYTLDSIIEKIRYIIDNNEISISPCYNPMHQPLDCCEEVPDKLEGYE
jgi:hypothetical protein